MTNDIETLPIDRLEWFRRKVAEIGELLRRLPASRRDKLLNTLDGTDAKLKVEQNATGKRQT